jgi:WbqC-like protein family
MSNRIPEKKIAILQSNYIPWKGYFDIISAVDEFLIFDDVQFTRRDWRNRNRIVQGGKPLWLTIPVGSKGAFDAPINTIAVAEQNWARKHWASIRHAYAKAPYFHEIAPKLETAYTKAAEFKLLTDVNEHFLRVISEMLELSTTFLRTDEIPRQALDPTGRLVEICRARKATLYLSGPAAKSYIDNAQFEAAGIRLAYANYSDYPPYEQAMSPFEHGVSLVDTLMRCGPQTRSKLKSLQSPSRFLDAAV